MHKIKSVIIVASIGACLALLPSARAQISLQDGPSPIEYNSSNGVTTSVTTSLNTNTFTVTPGASVLVLFYGGRSQGDSPGSDPGTPTSLSWNGNALTRAVWTNGGASTWDDNSIYYLMSPPAGTGPVTGAVANTASQVAWMAYTLKGVNTNTAPATGYFGQNVAGATINNTISIPLTGDWAAVCGSASAGGPNNTETDTITTSPTGPTKSFFANNVGNLVIEMGSVENCSSGNLEFISTCSASGVKYAQCEAVFAVAPVTPPVAPTWTSVTTGNPAQVDLSWSPSTNATSYILEGGTNNGGPYTSFTNILTTNSASYTDFAVLSGVTYYYIVAASNFGGANISTQTNATPVGSPVPPLVGVGASGPGNLTVHWTIPLGATNFILERATTSGAETTYLTTTNTLYVDTGLTAGTTYYYEVQAIGPGGTSPPSVEASGIALASGWHLFDNFSLDTVDAALNGATGSAGLGKGWTNLGGGTPITVTNSSTFGGANYAQYTAGSVANIGDYESGLGIASTTAAATVFLEFSLPGVQDVISNVGATTPSELVAMNFDIDNSSPPTALTGSSVAGPSAQFNYDNSTGDGFFRVNNAGNFYYVTLSPSSTPYLAIPGDVYYFWFVINAAKNTYQIYLANGSVTGDNVDAGGLGAAPTLMWGTTTTNGLGSIITYGFRNVAAGGAGGQPVNYIGTGPGSSLGTVPQNEFANIYVDQTSQNLTNPVTGLAAVGTPQVLVQPQPLELFAGETAIFTAVGSAGVGYQWQSNGVNLANSGSVSGVTTSTLTISNATAADQASYSVIVNNPATGSFAASTPATLTIVTPTGAYETGVIASGASHYYALNETNNPQPGPVTAYDFAGSDNGVYGANVQNGYNGVYGPNVTNGLAGFPTNNYAAQFAGGDEPDNITIDSSWNLDTNTVTLTAWINPNTSTEPDSTAIILNRGTGNDVEGLIISSNGTATLGYTWNNDVNTTTWDSGLVPPQGQWSFVALTVTPSNALISMMNTNGVFSSTHVYPHPAAPFAGTTMIGDDPGLANGSLTFNGDIDEVGVYGQALSQGQLQTTFADASGLSDFGATNTITLLTTGNLYPAQTAQFSSVIGGSVPVALNWQIDGTNITDGPSPIGYISGSATPDLTISNLAPADSGQTYTVTLVSSNTFGDYTNTSPINLSIQSVNPDQEINTTEREASGLDWNTAGSWNDDNPVSVSIYAEPGSTYNIVPGTLERSPATTNAVFLGDVLVIQGNGVLLDGNAGTFGTETTTGELRLKQSGTANITNAGTLYPFGGTITFPDLELNGGQIDNGNSSIIAFEGEIDVMTNSAIYADSASGAANRSYEINAFLTGTGTLTYAFLGTPSADTANEILISGPTNTFSGQWNIGPGALVCNASNGLGTNSITINLNGALETTYDLIASNGNLTLNGQMYLYTDDTFYGVTINGSNLPPGDYTFAQLNTSFPTNFPVTWPLQMGSMTGTNTGTGSLTVLASLPPQFTQQPASLSLYPNQPGQFAAAVQLATNYQWWFTNLSNAGQQLSDGSGLSGSLTTTLTISNAVSAEQGTYVLVATGPGGTTLSSPATMTLLSSSPAETITTLRFEAAGDDWNTATNWSDDLPASVSIYANPGSTYEIVPGSMERSPASTNAVFPGDVLVVQGDGGLLNGSDPSFGGETTIGELRLKENGGVTETNFGTLYTFGGTVTFPDLQLQGGQIDNGSASVVAVDGEIDVQSNSCIYVDSSGNNSIRSFQVNAYLTGTGMLTYSFLGTNNYTNNDLIISCPTNIFSGQWNILQGALLGNAPNSLGTNSITIETNGALETTYNLVATNGTLTLYGQMYLYTADTFYAVSVDGTNLSPGTYSLSSLSIAYPGNFPLTWPVQLGSMTGTNTGFGSLTVLTGPSSAPPPQPARFTAISLLHGNLTFAGTNGAPSGTYHLLTTTNLALSVTNWAVLTNGSFDGSGNFSLTVPVANGSSQQFYSIESP